MNIRSDLLGNLRSATASVALLAAGAGLSIAMAPSIAAAQEHGSGGHDSGSDHQDSDHGDSDHSDHGSQGQKGKGRSPGEASEAHGHRSMDDIFRAITSDSDDDDSDRPDWAGGGGGPNDHAGKPSTAGSARGDLYGDMYVILRDDNGVPILNDDGYVQPIDADGNLIPLDDEGAPIDPTLAIEVEIGRLNVGRAPTQVLDRRAEEVITLLNSATAIETDAAGRLVVTNADGTKTIDAPLENLAIYVALMTEGTIPGVTDLPGTEFDYLVDGILTSEDMVAAAHFLAGAADKFTSLSADAIAYENAFLDIDTQSAGSVTWSDVDYSSYSYDRADTYGDVTATILVQQPDGSWVPTEVNILETVFGGNDYSGTGTFEAFATAVDDARAVVNYIHEYEVPADEPPTKD